MVCDCNSQDAQKGRPARPQPPNAPEAYPLGYVEDAFKARTKLAGFLSILLYMSHFLTTQIYLSHTIIRLHLLDGAFANNGALMQDRDDAGDLPDELHVVLDDDDRLFFRQ